MIRLEIAFEPYKKISFQSYLPYNETEELVTVITQGAPDGIPFQTQLYWANGVLFRFFNHPPCDAVTKEALNGHIIWDHIEFAPMLQYKRELKQASKPLGTIIVLNVSNHVVFDPLTAWIRDNLIKK